MDAPQVTLTTTASIKYAEVSNGIALNWSPAQKHTTTQSTTPRLASTRSKVRVEDLAASMGCDYTGGLAPPLMLAPYPHGSEREKATSSASQLPIDITTMADFDDHDDKIKILNRIQDPIVSLSNTVLVVPRELLAAWRPRVARQRQDVRDDPSAILLWESFYLFGG
jgi:hypothetical protein